MYYLASLPMLVLIVAIFRVVVGNLYVLGCVLLDALARYLFFDYSDSLARVYVRLEAVAFRLRLFKFGATHVSINDPEPPIILMQGREYSVPLPIGTANNVLRVLVAAVLLAIAELAQGVGYIVRQIFQPRWRNLMALVVALWYSDLLVPLGRAIGRMRIGDVHLSVVVAAGTLLAVGYAAANSDLRGRAELNKTASVSCRTVLHSCTTSLLSAQARLASIRVAAEYRLSQFPTQAELHHLTGRYDLVWVGRHLLPDQAGLLSHRFRKVKIFDDTVGYKYVDQLDHFRKFPSAEDRSLLHGEDTSHVYEKLEVASKDIQDKLRELRDEGFLGKLDRVLNAPAFGVLVLLSAGGFGVNIARIIIKPTGGDSFGSYVFDGLLQDLRAFANCEPDDPALRASCEQVTKLTRRIVRKEHERLWEAALTEGRLRYLAEAIDQSLRPRAIERVRQAFGK